MASNGPIGRSLGLDDTSLISTAMAFDKFHELQDVTLFCNVQFHVSLVF